MKKLFITLLLVILPFLVNAQASPFAKFEDKTGITSVIVNKKMFELMSNVKIDPKDKDGQRYLSLVKKLESLRVFTTTNGKYAGDMKNTMDGYLKSNPLDELMRINDSGKSIKIYVKQGATSSQVKELLMFIDGAKGDDTVLMSLTGNFDLDDISMLTERMSLPGGNELKKAAKKKG